MQCPPYKGGRPPREARRQGVVHTSRKPNVFTTDKGSLMEKVISLFGMKLPVKTAASDDRETSGGNNSVEYLYDKSKRLSKVLYPEGTSQTFAYDPHGNLRERKTAQGQSFRYGYDAH